MTVQPLMCAVFRNSLIVLQNDRTRGKQISRVCMRGPILAMREAPEADPLPLLSLRASTTLAPAPFLKPSWRNVRMVRLARATTDACTRHLFLFDYLSDPVAHSIPNLSLDTQRARALPIRLLSHLLARVCTALHLEGPQCCP